MSKAKRANRSDLGLRIDQAELLLLQGLSDRQAYKILRDRFDVSTRQAQRYVQQVYERWRKALNETDGRTVDDRRVEHERMVRLALASAIKAGRIDLQLRAIDTLIKLHGTGASRVELTGANGGPVEYKNLTDSELRQLIEDAGVDEVTVH